MDDVLSLLTVGWFLKHAIVGVIIGYLFRITEHIIWSTKAEPKDNPLGNLVFSLTIIPQTIAFSWTLGYVLLTLVALYFKNIEVLETAAYLVTAFFAFIADDLRGLIRRAYPRM